MAKVRVDTSRFSTVEVDEDRILSFPDGIIGFPDCRRFALLAIGEGPFMWLQSVDHPDLAFAVTDPLVFVPDYRPEVDDDTLRDLGVKSSSDLKYLAIAVVPQDVYRTTINLQAPIAVNEAQRLARQVITMNPENPIKCYIFDPGECASTGHEG